MRSVDHRRLTVFDCMVLVGSAGVGLSWVRAYQQAMANYARPGIPAGTLTFPISMRYFTLVAPLVISTTLALFLLRLVSPRPGYRRLVRSPGFIFCVSAMLGVAISLLTILISEISRPRGQYSAVTELFYITNRLLNYSTPAVSGAWFCLYLNGRWRLPRNQDWVEVSSITLGVAWHIIFLLMKISG